MFPRGAPSNSVALCAWAHAVDEGTITAEGMRFAEWVRMARTTHMLHIHEFHSVFCSTPCFGWGDYTVRDFVAVVAAGILPHCPFVAEVG